MKCLQILYMVVFILNLLIVDLALLDTLQIYYQISQPNFVRVLVTTAEYCLSFQTTTPSGGQTSDTANTPYGLGGLGGLSGLGALGMGSANFMEMQQRMQREVG